MACNNAARAPRPSAVCDSAPRMLFGDAIPYSQDPGGPIPSNRFVDYSQQSLAHGQEGGQKDGQCVFMGFSDVLSSFLAPILPTDEATRAVAHPENKG